ncbi:MAG: FIG00389692: hypothetical protein, partial [uncultured Arthrobacter sp.]
DHFPLGARRPRCVGVRAHHGRDGGAGPRHRVLAEPDRRIDHGWTRGRLETRRVPCPGPVGPPQPPHRGDGPGPPLRLLHHLPQADVGGRSDRPGLPPGGLDRPVQRRARVEAPGRGGHRAHHRVRRRRRHHRIRPAALRPGDPRRRPRPGRRCPRRDLPDGRSDGTAHHVHRDVHHPLLRRVRRSPAPAVPAVPPAADRILTGGLARDPRGDPRGPDHGPQRVQSSAGRDEPAGDLDDHPPRNPRCRAPRRRLPQRAAPGGNLRGAAADPGRPRRRGPRTGPFPPGGPRGRPAGRGTTGARRGL